MSNRQIANRLRHAATVAAGALLATTIVVAGGAAPTSAAPVATLNSKTVAPDTTVDSPALPGAELVYTINYSCSGLGGTDNCSGAVITDVLPTFTDIYGDTNQLQLVSGSASTPDDWSFQNDGGASGTVPTQSVSWIATSNLVAGDSGAVTLTLRVPPGIVPDTAVAQQISNTATLSFGAQTDAAGPAVSFIDANTPSSTLAKSGPATATLNAAGTDDFTHTINVCPAAGSPLWESYTVTDTLPPGVTVVTVPPPFGGVYTPGTPSTSTPGPMPGDPDVIIPGTGGTIVWNLTPANRPPVNTQGCLPISFDVRYVNAAAGGDLTNVIGEMKTNSVSAVGSNSAGGSQSFGPATTTLTLNGPITRFSPSKNTGGNFYVQNGDTVVYSLGASNTSDLEAPGFTSATLADGPFPAQYTLTEIKTGTWTEDDGPVTASIETSPDGSTWSQVSTVKGATITTGLGGVRYVRWVFTSGSEAIRRGWSASGQQLTGTVAGSPPPSATLANCASLDGVQSGVTQSRGAACANTSLEIPTPHPSITKTAPNTVNPGDTVTYTLIAGNDADATGNLIDPQLTDCVPYSERLVVSNLLADGDPLPANGWGVEAGPSPSTCTPTQPNTPGSGTFIQLQYTGTLAPGEDAPSITYDVTANGFQLPDPGDDPAEPGTYDNTVTITNSDGTPFVHCVQAGCEATESIVVPVSAVLRSEKLVLGSLDNGFNKAGTTTAGGQVTWKLEVQNVGNVEVADVQYVDVFGHVGDTGVVLSTQQRGSEYTPFLTSPITATPGWTIEYSLSNNPCRPEVLGPDTPDCDAPDWTDTPDLADLPLYRSVRLSFSGRIAIAETLTFEYDMVTPVFDPTYDTPNTTASPYDLLADCTIPISTPPYDFSAAPNTTGPGDSTLVGSRTEVSAWNDTNSDGVQQAGEGGPTCPRSSNSFAYGVTVPADQLGGLPNPGRLSAEPPQVDLHVAAAPTSNVIGSRVWEDYDNDGIQDDPTTEPGIAFVRVDLYTDGGTFVDTTFTDPDGNYLFEQLPDGAYVVRFYMPDDLGYISLADQTGSSSDQLATADNTDDDSDIPQAPTGADAIGNYYETVIVQLGNDPASPSSEIDPSWDAGLWLPKPAIGLKKYVNGDDAQITPGPDVPKGDAVVWTYDITNTGNTYLKDVALTDVVTISGEADPAPVCDWSSSSDPMTPPGVLSRAETVSCTASSVAITGQYGNGATAVGTTVLDDGVTPITGKVDDAGDPIATTVTDNDPAHYFGVEYDLALAKIADVSSVAQGGTVVWTIRVVNQGNVPSLPYTVTDVIPEGLTVTGSTPSSTSDVGRTINWVRPNLAPGATDDIVITTTVSDINQRPFRNWAEISNDSSGMYSTTDFDSTPDTTTGDDDGPGAGTGPDDQFIDNLSLTAIPDTVVGDEDDNDAAEVTGTVTYDLALVKTVSPTPLIGIDGLATWTITVKNQGDVDSRGYVVTDVVPAGLAVLSTTPVAFSTSGRTSTWQMPNLAPGDTATITIDTTVTNQASKPFVNWAEISSDGSSFYTTVAGTVTDVDSTPDPNLGDDPGVGSGTGPTDGAGNPENNVDRLNDSDVDTDLGVGVDEDDSDQAVLNSDILYDLALVKTADAPTVAPDGTITWTITVKNQGNVDSGAYVVTDTVPDGLTVDSATPAASGQVGRVYSWTMPNLAPDGEATITITTSIGDVNLRPFRNWAEISADSAQALYGAVDDDSTPDAVNGDDDGGGTDLGDPPNDIVVDQTALPGAQYNDPSVDEDDNDLAEVDVSVEYDLALIKTVSPAVVGEDGLVTWTITTANQGNVDSQGFVVRDVLPAGMSFVSATPTPDGNPAPGVYTWNVANLAPAQTTSIAVVTRATDLKQRSFRNWAEISSDSSDTYDVPGTNVEDDDSVPDATLGADPGPGTGTDPNDLFQNHNDINFDAGTPAGFGGADEDDSDFEDVTANPVYDLALAKIADTPSVAYDEQPVWRTRVYNQGNVSSGPIVVTDTLPTGLSHSSSEVLASAGTPLAGASCGVVGFTVTCSIPNIAVGDHVDVVITTSIIGGDLSTAPWRNWAEISSDSGQARYGVDDIDSVPDATTGRDDTLSTNDSYVGVPTLAATYPPGPGWNDPAIDQDDHDDAVIDTTSFYDLALVKTGSAATIQYDDQVTFTITAQNQGNVPSGTFDIVDRVPPGLLPADLNGGTWNSTDRTITWTIPDITPGTIVSTSYIAVVSDVTLRPFRNVAEIGDDSADDLYGITDIDSTPDTDPTNDGLYPSVGSPAGTDTDNVAIGEAGNESEEDDADIADLDVDVVYDLALAKVVDATDLALNGPESGSATFEITVQNQGTVPSHDFDVTDWVPAGLEPVLPIANSGSWNAVDRTITWTVVDLTPGATTTLEYDVTVSDITLRGYRNVAEISDDSSEDYSTATVTVTDADSEPDAITTNDGSYPALLSPAGTGIDNIDINEAGIDNGDPEDDADIADLTFDVVYDLALSKVADAAVVSYDDTITFTVTVQNQGNVDSNEFTITDTVPAGLQPALPIPDGGTWNDADRTITWTIGNLNGAPNLDPGETASVSYGATIVDITQRPFRNIAEISADSADDYDAPLIDISDVDSNPDLVVDNDGAYPDLVEFPTPGTGIDDLVIDDATSGATDQDDADIADVGVDVVYDLQLIKTADANEIEYDGSVTYTLAVLNQGTVPSGSFTVTDWIPAGLVVVDPGGGVQAGGTLTWTITDSLAPGESVAVSFTVEISDITLRPYRNVAEITADSADDYDTSGVAPLDVFDIDSTPDSNPIDDVQDINQTDFQPGTDGNNDAAVDSDDHDFEPLTIAVEYDLALAKTSDNSDLISNGLAAGTSTFTIHVQNQGNVPSNEITVTDWVPVGIEPGPISGGGTWDASERTIVWTVPQLLPGATLTLTYAVSVTDITQQPFRNIAEITSDSADDYSSATETITDADSVPNDVTTDDGAYPPLLSDPGAGIDNLDVSEAGADGSGDEDDADIADLAYPVVYDLALAKTADTSVIQPDGVVTFTVRVKNQGNVPSNVFTITDRLPDGLGLVSPFVGTYNAPDHTLTWVVDQLAPGDSQTFFVTMSIDDITLRPYRNIAEISADSADDYDAQGLDADALIDVEDADSTPDGDTTNDGSYGPVGTPSDIDNTADGAIDQAGTGPDAPPEGEDDADIADVTVEVEYDLALVKILSPGQRYGRGDVIEFMIDVMNQGNVDSGAFTFVDHVPAGMSYVSASAGGTHADGLVSWTISNLEPGEIQRVTVELRLDDVTLPSYDNIAEIVADSAVDYASPTEQVTDDDSVPDRDAHNDTIAQTDDVTTEGSVLDEDDHDVASLDIAQVQADNPPPPPPPQPLPSTGTGSMQTLTLAFLALLLGAMLTGLGRRRRHAASC